MDLTGGGALYSLTPKSVLEDLQGVNEGLNNKYPLQGRGRSCANGSEQTISGEGLVKESLNLVDMFDLAILHRYTPQNDKKNLPYSSLEKGAEEKSLLLERRCHEVTEDLGVNKGVKIKSPLIPLYQRGQQECSFSKGAGAKHLMVLGNHVILNLFQDLESEQILDCHSERSEESQSRAKENDCTLTIAPSNLERGLIKSPLPPFKKGSKKVAFTLAEVLVTLGIIGILAAMTMPMLAENYQRRVVETRLKKFYTTFNQAILRSVDVNGPFDGWGYWFNDQFDVNGNIIHQADNIVQIFDLYLRPYLNISQTQKIIYTNGQETYLYYLSDGSAFTYSTHTSRDIYYYPKDPVRCLKQSASNRVGVCQFFFIFAPTQKSSAWRFHTNKGLEPYMAGWDGTVGSLFADARGYRYGCNLNEYGYYCTALIQYNNWQFPKDYPRKIRY